MQRMQHARLRFLPTALMLQTYQVVPEAIVVLTEHLIDVPVAEVPVTLQVTAG